MASGHRNTDPMSLPLLLIAAILSPTCKVTANIHNYRIEPYMDNTGDRTQVTQDGDHGDTGK